ncbi:hypothetical protein ASG14_07125 [Pedobacter sp. Leaf194]|nr:hypothetical protein ASG14_07125 [Pedobacter sp. Leaf194]
MHIGKLIVARLVQRIGYNLLLTFGFSDLKFQNDLINPSGISSRIHWFVLVIEKKQNYSHSYLPNFCVLNV